jgi:hypothetical protein
LSFKTDHSDNVENSVEALWLEMPQQPKSQRAEVVVAEQLKDNTTKSLGGHGCERCASD